jgi:hypothetical protein
MFSWRVRLYASDEVLLSYQPGNVVPFLQIPTGINTGLGCPPYPHQPDDPEDEDRDGLQNVGIYKNGTTLPS